MTNPVDDSPPKPGAIALPLDPSDPQPNDGARLRKFRRRALYVFAVCFTIAAITLWEHPPTIRRPIAELPRASGTVNIAYDPRLDPYQTPENAEYCAEWVLATDKIAETETERQIASASFKLPTTADLLFFLSRGPVSGHIAIVKSASYSTGPIEVNVTAQYHDRTDLERTKACRMGPANEHGVLIWAEPRHPHADPTRDVRFNITVAVPTGVRDYKDLTTDLALFAHNIGDFFDLWSPTSFEVVWLKSSNAPIDHGSLIGRSAFIQTSNAQATGFFGGLVLVVQTINAPIISTAFMFGESDGSESHVQLKTSNGNVTAALSLVSDFKDNGLRTVIRTSNGALTIFTPRYAMADDSRFFLDAVTSNGPAEVSLYPQYEGTYDLRTSGAQLRIEEGKEVSDPKRQGRHRTVTRKSTGKHAQGSIYWSNDGNPPEGWQRGSVNVTTSGSPVKLYC